jgi:DNA-binding NtrC family response regulator
MNSNLQKLQRPAQVECPIGNCPKFITALDIAKRVAPSLANLFLFGESGTGKEIFANYIHKQSKRSSGPFVPINCSAIPDNLFESECFGHTKGSFTGALNHRVGFFEAAKDGTLFLDEVADLSSTHQAKILRALQDKKIKPLGSNNEVSVNCRIISATHKNLAKEVLSGRFREDLFFRLNVIPIFLPPLRDRKDDISLLAHLFLRKFAAPNNSKVIGFTDNAMKFLMNNKWRGNVRELENAIERAVIMATSFKIDIDDLLSTGILGAELSTVNQNDIEDVSEAENTFCVFHEDVLPTLDNVINEYVNYAVEHNHGAKDKTAKEIGIDRKTLYKRVQKSELKKA